MRISVKILLMCAVCVVVIAAFTIEVAFAADPGPSEATCAISVTVDSIIEWEGASFAALAPANITAQASAPTDSSVYTLWTNCNVALSADNTATAQLSCTTDTLATKYRVSDDGDGTATTGATAAAEATSGVGSFVLYNSFLTSALAISHVNADGAVEITLYVEASNYADDVSDSDTYTATQTITATWTSDS